MPRVFSVSDSVLIRGVTPEAVYAEVSDPRRIPRWSPENTGATLSAADWADGARVGLDFAGHNKRGPVRWSTQCRVTAAEPGVRFAFRVHAFGPARLHLKAPIASWEYRFEATPEGTRVTETWTDDRRSWPTPVANAFDRLATRGRLFADFQRGNIRRTLDRLRTTLEP
ncbi:SRPBCC family protein (plasmid) [Streptomyces sp. BI20]|uniref:SRPBCC family protein n=1 Tax=Streptomyces sp. BI20 TaxID=3403460 RepID=UPI003C77BA16